VFLKSVAGGRVRRYRPRSTMDDFYARTLRRLVERGLMALEDRVLVVCGGPADRAALQEVGFRHVTISNLDERMRGDEFAPYAWSYQDAEALASGEGTFDHVIAHSGLHHCYSPHRALLEMYRVARRCVVVFEPRDTFLVRLGVKLNFGQEYEVAAVAGNDLRYGGVRNTEIPNYIYRWTEREIEKTIATFDPRGRARHHYHYGLRVPEERLRAMKNRVAATAVRVLLPALRVLTALFPRQANCFAFVIEKVQLPRDLHPWLALAEGRPRIRADWVRKRYGDFGAAGADRPSPAPASSEDGRRGL
jgi:ubiquinone/menaquinone biosynthesis C-methylase UbiE